MSQTQGETRDIEFDGRIQLSGDAAPDLEVIIELNDRHLVLGHSSGELGRWKRDAVRVAPIGRGWFTIDVEDDQVTFLPRRPGYFAAATVDLLPPVEEPKKRGRRKAREKKPKEPKTSPPSRRERGRWRREESVLPAVSPVGEPAEPPTTETVAPADVQIPASPPVERPTPAEPDQVPAKPAPTPEPAEEPVTPWDDLPVPEVPGRKGRDKKRPRRAPDASLRSAQEKQAKPRKDKPPKPSRDKRPKPQKPVEKAIRPPTAEPAGPPKPSVLSRAFAGFRYGVKGLAFRISDELRQTGIVPFDRLPAAPGRTRPDENHEHTFQEHRLPGGLLRNVCHSCGLVSIGESGQDD